MFWDVVANLLNFNLGWFIELAANNLFWVFVYPAIAYFFFGQKKMLLGPVLVWLYNWISVEATNILGWAFLAAEFLAIFYITRLAVISFAETIPSLKNRLPLIITMQFVGVVFIYNVFLVGA